MTSFSYDEIYDISDITSAVLKRLGYDSCIVGSAACVAWGMRNRTPQDVDIVVLEPTVDIETVKKSLVASDARFHLVNSVNPVATYRVLWFRYQDARQCKVDLLKPGELAIPSVPLDQLYKLKNRDNIRVMPFIPVLLLKVQAWWHHNISRKPHFRKKVPHDIGDIKELLDIAVVKGYKLNDVENWLPQSFQDLCRRHVTLFEWEFRSTSNSWAKVML